MRRLKLISAIIAFIAILGGSVFSIIYFSKQEIRAKIVVTIFPIYDICREILGNDDDILLLQDDGMDLHSYSPTTKDIATINESELFIYVGGESEEWVDRVTKTALSTTKLSLLDKIEGIEEHHDHIEEHEHNEEVYDEHIWLSIKNMKIMTSEISKSLKSIFPNDVDTIENNTVKYLAKLNALDEEYKEVCNDNSNPIVIADRFPFMYLVRDYNVKYFAAFSACASESDASLDVITQMIDIVNEYELDYIFVLESSTKETANRVIESANCREGVSMLVLDSCQSVNTKKKDNTSYLDIMKNNLENIKKALV